MDYQERFLKFRGEVRRAMSISDSIQWNDRKNIMSEDARRIGATCNLRIFHEPQVRGRCWKEFMETCESSSEQRWLCTEEASEFLYHEIEALGREETMKSVSNKSVYMPFMIKLPAHESEYRLGVVGFRLFFKDDDLDFPAEGPQNKYFMDRHLYMPDKNIVEYSFESVGSKIRKAATEKKGSVYLTRIEDMWMRYFPEKMYFPFHESKLKYQH